ncbi:hypothetical protein AB0F43_31950 [Kribbella sp. NPDC023972]|uniref:tetratricopeptide repeat protein n=1 Tax=Kribbella sp. NPDC023972 TaxID=3154795 RepID=UPI0033C39584
MAEDGAFVVELRRLRSAAGLTYGSIIKRAAQQVPPIFLTAQTLSDWFRGAVKVPRDPKAQDRLIILLEAEARRRDPAHESHPIEWWRVLRGASLESPCEDLGRLVGELSEDQAQTYGVRRAISSEQVGAPVLPPYMKRTHDIELREELLAATSRSRIVMVVGGSSTGKSRACWEAIREALPGWRVWHPLAPDRPEAVIGELTAGRVAPRTVVWLDEAHMYLLPEGIGARVASTLQQLLQDPGGPILVLGSMWPRYWEEMTRGDKAAQHAAASALLASSHRIHVPPSFTGPELTAARTQIDGDDRLRAAAAVDGGVTQYLAAAPELMRRYQDAGEYPRAIIHAAMDARRHSRWLYLPADFLRCAALGYLTDSALGRADDTSRWFETAMESLTEECHGADGVLAPRKVLHERQNSMGYKLADYLEQHGRRTRPAGYPPASFWGAVAQTCTDPAVLFEFARRADDRGRRHRAATLYYLAAEYGETEGQVELARLLGDIGDLEGAVQSAQAAADRGAPQGLQGVAMLMEQAGDRSTAVRLLRQAADDHGDLGAVMLLRALEESGDERLVIEDPRRNLALAEEAADQAAVALEEQESQFSGRYEPEDLARPWEKWWPPVLHLEDAGDLAGAERLAYAAADRGNPEGLRRLARIRAKAGDLPGAERLAYAAADYGNSEGLEDLARIRMGTGDHADAERLTYAAADRGARSALRYLAMGRRHAGDYAGAERLLLDGADRAGLWALRDLAIVRRHVGDHAGAEQIARYGLADDRTPARPWNLESIRLEKPGETRSGNTSPSSIADDIWRSE